MSNNGAAADGIKYPQPLPHCNLPVSAPSSWLEARWEEGAFTPPLPNPPPTTAHQSATPSSLKQQLYRKNPEHCCIIYFLLCIIFSMNADVVCVCGTVMIFFFSIHSFTLWFNPHEAEGLQIDYKSTWAFETETNQYSLWVQISNSSGSLYIIDCVNRPAWKDSDYFIPLLLRNNQEMVSGQEDFLSVNFTSPRCLQRLNQQTWEVLFSHYGLLFTVQASVHSDCNNPMNNNVGIKNST